MQVNLLCFGILREVFSTQAGSMELPEGARVAELLDRLRSLRPEAVRSLAVAVNRVYAGADHVLHEGDEVALLPPVSGGCRHAG